MKGGSRMDQIKIGQFLKELRKEKALTQEQLAEHFGVSGRTVSRWENGNNMPDISILIELADYYSVDIRELIDGERKSEDMDMQTKEIVEKVVDYTTEDKEQVIKQTLHESIAGIITLATGIILALFYTGSNTVVINIRDMCFSLTAVALFSIFLYSSGKAAEMKKNKRKQKIFFITMIAGLILIGFIITVLTCTFSA